METILINLDRQPVWAAVAAKSNAYAILMLLLAGDVKLVGMNA
jgi:hypothetical protein